MLEGKVIKEIDTYAPTVNWNETTVLVDKAADKDAARTVKVRVAGRNNPDSSDAYVQIVGFSNADTLCWSKDKAWEW